ncbi:MAG: hypothetical protein HKO59_01170 [Phycisphaerales bacterium]|nr:hypothetical protein [Phycisphaerae bacterium]NNF41843.1 hypothetical protein [Phycisphaerales bacterium]NNM24590.1 hypothetical protein [Phycisphaerales bacterium]
MEESVRHFAIGGLFFIGLSHVVRPVVWARFFGWIGSAGDVGSFVNGMLAITWGLFIAVFHNVWTGLPVLLTVIGWLSVLKGAVYLLFPAFGTRIMTTAATSGTKFRLAGAALLVVAATLAFA